MTELYDTNPGEPRVPLRATSDGALRVAVVSGGSGGGGGSGTSDTTEATQLLVKAAVEAINTKTPALAGGRTPVDGSGVTQPVSATALPLPAGASTSAKQDALLAALLATPSDIALDSTGVAFSPASCSHVYGYDGSGNLTTDTATTGSTVRVKTMTYTGGNLTGESKWVAQ